MALPEIQLGAAPLLWSEVANAFEQINNNFSEVSNSISILGGGEVSLATIGTDVLPTKSNRFSVGSTTNKWQSAHFSAWTTADQGNGVWIGSAQIKGIGGIIDIPYNSTVGGVSINLPAFKMISAVNSDSANGSSILASENSEVATFEGSLGIRLSSSSNTNTITITNAVDEILAAGDGIDLNTVNGITTISGTGVASLSAGSGISLSIDVNTRHYTITNTSPIVPFFRTINVANKPSIYADIQSDILTLVAGTGIGIETDAASDTITFNAVNSIQELSGLSSGDVVLTAITLTGNLLTGNPTANRILKLPNASVAMAGKAITIVNRSSTFSLTITDTSDAVIKMLTGQPSAIQLVCDGYNWYSL